MRFSFWLTSILIFTSFFSFPQKLKNKVSYKLESVFVAKQNNKLAKDKASLIFNTKEKTAKCNLSCTNIALNYKLKKSKILFTAINSNLLPCPDHLLGLESDLKENFSHINYYQIKNKKLYFFDRKDTLLIFYEQ